MIAAFVARLVDVRPSPRRRGRAGAACRDRWPRAGYAATHLDLDTDIEQLLPSDTAWRQQEIALDRAFPQNANLLAIVVDGATPDEAAERRGAR